MTSSLPLHAVRPIAALLKALGDENRLRILALLAPAELCVCHIVEALQLSQPNVSQHLTVLRHAGLVDSERRGTGSWSSPLSAARPQRLTDELAARGTWLVTMGCAEQCPHVPGLRRADWPLEDPKGRSPERVAEVRDEVRARVGAFVQEQGWAR